MAEYRRIQARGFREAEDKIERNLTRNPEGKYELWIDGKLAYRVSDAPPKNMLKQRGRYKK